MRFCHIGFTGPTSPIKSFNKPNENLKDRNKNSDITLNLDELGNSFDKVKQNNSMTPSRNLKDFTSHTTVFPPR